MMSWVTAKKKFKYERELKEMIEFNRERRKMYASASQDFNNLDSTIYKMYDFKLLDEIKTKYDLNAGLVDQAKRSADKTKREYNKMEERVNKYKAEQEELETIRLYKKAILELRKENKL